MKFGLTGTEALSENAIRSYARMIDLSSVIPGLPIIIEVVVVEMRHPSGNQLLALVIGSSLVSYALARGLSLLVGRIPWANRVRIGLACNPAAGQYVCLKASYHPPFLGIESLTEAEITEVMARIRKLNGGGLTLARLDDLETAYAEFTELHNALKGERAAIG